MRVVVSSNECSDEVSWGWLGCRRSAEAGRCSWWGLAGWLAGWVEGEGLPPSGRPSLPCGKGAAMNLWRCSTAGLDMPSTVSPPHHPTHPHTHKHTTLHTACPRSAGGVGVEPAALQRGGSGHAEHGVWRRTAAHHPAHRAAAPAGAGHAFAYVGLKTVRVACDSSRGSACKCAGLMCVFIWAPLCIAGPAALCVFWPALKSLGQLPCLIFMPATIG